MRRWSDGSYLEAQDFGRISGIQRNVDLYSRPDVHFYDLFVKSLFINNYRDGDLSFDVELWNRTNEDQVDNRVQVNLIDAEGNSILELPKIQDTFSWYGRGPWECYEDRKSSAMVGIYEGTVKDQYHPYVLPQESGNKTDVRWAKVTGGRRTGIKIHFVDDLLDISALPYSWHQLYPSSQKGQEHSGLLEEDEVTHLNVDLKQMGVAGINSWGSLALEKYRVPFKDYSYTYIISPVR